MNQAAISAGPAPVAPLEADGDVIDIVLLQLHVGCATAWLAACCAVLLLAVPRLGRLLSDVALGALAGRRDLLFRVLWWTCAVTLGTGMYLLFQQAVYDPPLSPSEFRALGGSPFGRPYFYALYGKIALFLLMAAATALLAAEARRLMSHPESRTDWQGPVEIGTGAGDGPGDRIALALRPSRLRVPLSVTGLWGSVAILVAGGAGIALCVTLAKYFHELARAGVTYQQLRGR